LKRERAQQRLRRRGLRLTVLLFGLVVGFAAGVLATQYFGAPGFANNPRRDGGRSQEQPVGATVVALGRLEPDGGLISVGAPMGDRLSRIVVKVGQEVKEGEELAQLESCSERLAEKNLAASQLQEATTRRAAFKASGENMVRQAALRIEQVQQEGPFDLLAQQAKIRLIEAQRDSAVKELARLKDASGQVVAPQQLSQQVLAVRQAEEELAGAQAVLDKLKTGHKINLRSAQLHLEAAEADLARSQAEIPIDSLEKNLALAETRWKRTVIAAPRDGKILRILGRPGEAVGAQPILLMGDPRQMFAVAEVYETDRRRIQLGSKATLTSPALAAELTGSVVEIGGLIAKNNTLDLNPTADADRRIVEVKIRLDQGDSAADYINMQVTVTITP
jgi:HlyD family secretion protein